MIIDPLFSITDDQVALTSDEWYTPRWLFTAAGLTFDLDVAAPVDPRFRTCPARAYITAADDGLTADWHGLVWMNPPYSNPAPWVDRFIAHPNGLALVPAASSMWRGRYLNAADGIVLLSVTGNEMRAGRGFGRPDGSQASYPVALILAARGDLAMKALEPIAKADPYAAGAYHVKPPALP